MKSVLISIQPYWVFLIIAKIMGWSIDKEKTVEVRKSYPKYENWDKVAKIYCSKDKKSFAKIPKEYQPFMEWFLGKVIGEFICDKITVAECGNYVALSPLETQLHAFDLLNYADEKTVYGWHISELVIYDKPRELSQFKRVKKIRGYHKKDEPKTEGINIQRIWHSCRVEIKYFTRPPQSWCCVE